MLTLYPQPQTWFLAYLCGNTNLIVAREPINEQVHLHLSQYVVRERAEEVVLIGDRITTSKIHTNLDSVPIFSQRCHFY